MNRAALPLALCLALLAPVASAKTIVCVDPASGDATINMVEGYFRSFLTVPPDEIHTNDLDLQDCLNRAHSGDKVIIVAHGGWYSDGTEGGVFTWNGHDKHGFGGGTHIINLQSPQGVSVYFTGLSNLDILIVSCFSDHDPDPAPSILSVCETLRRLFSPSKNAKVSGYNGFAQVKYAVEVRNATSQAQQDAALDYLESKRDVWQKYPPSNRPGATKNQRTAMDSLLLEHFPNKSMQSRVLYQHLVDAPSHEPYLAATSWPQDTATSIPCADVAQIEDIAPVAPALHWPGVAALALGLLGAGLTALRASRMGCPQT